MELEFNIDDHLSRLETQAKLNLLLLEFQDKLNGPDDGIEVSELESPETLALVNYEYILALLFDQWKPDLLSVQANKIFDSDVYDKFGPIEIQDDECDSDFILIRDEYAKVKSFEQKPGETEQYFQDGNLVFKYDILQRKRPIQEYFSEMEKLKYKTQDRKKSKMSAIVASKYHECASCDAVEMTHMIELLNNEKDISPTVVNCWLKWWMRVVGAGFANSVDCVEKRTYDSQYYSRVKCLQSFQDDEFGNETVSSKFPNDVLTYDILIIPIYQKDTKKWILALVHCLASKIRIYMIGFEGPAIEHKLKTIAEQIQGRLIQMRDEIMSEHDLEDINTKNIVPSFKRTDSKSDFSFDEANPFSRSLTSYTNSEKIPCLNLKNFSIALLDAIIDEMEEDEKSYIKSLKKLGKLRSVIKFVRTKITQEISEFQKINEFEKIITFFKDEGSIDSGAWVCMLAAQAAEKKFQSSQPKNCSWKPNDSFHIHDTTNTAVRQFMAGVILCPPNLVEKNDSMVIRMPLTRAQELRDESLDKIVNNGEQLQDQLKKTCVPFTIFQRFKTSHRDPKDSYLDDSCMMGWFKCWAEMEAPNVQVQKQTVANYAWYVKDQIKDSPGGLERCIIIDSQYFDQFFKQEHELNYRNYPSNLFDFQKIFFPINLPNHWIVIEIDLEAKILTHYDPLQSENDLYINKSLELLQQLQVSFSEQKWCLQTLEFMKFTRDNFTAWPRQADGINCGVWSAMFVAYRSQNDASTPDNEAMANLRKVMAQDILKYAKYKSEA